MEDENKKEETRIEEFGAALTDHQNSRIYTLTIIGQVEGHQVLPETCKTTKYEHVLPLLASIEESNDVDSPKFSEQNPFPNYLKLQRITLYPLSPLFWRFLCELTAPKFFLYTLTVDI